MRLHRTLLNIAAASLAGLVLAGGCVIDVGQWRHDGQASLSWTIDHGTDPAACDRRRAARVEVRTYDAWGAVRSVVGAPCAAFATTIALESGWYNADLVMVDSVGRSVTQTAKAEPFWIARQETTYLPTIDFRGCRDIPPVGASFCQAGVIAERIDSFGCLAEYVCMIDGRPANPCEALGGACLPIVHGVCRIWGQPESCDAAVGVGCCLVPASVTAQSYPVTASR